MTEAIEVVKTRELVRVGDRSISMFGWQMNLVLPHLKEHLAGEVSGKSKWCSVACMARTMYHTAHAGNLAKVRNNTRGTFKKLLESGHFMVIQYDMTRGGRGRIKAFKLFMGTDDMERQYAQLQVDRMRRRREVSEQTLQQALQLIES